MEYPDNKGALGCWQRVKCVDLHACVCVAAGRGWIVNLNRNEVNPGVRTFPIFLQLSEASAERLDLLLNQRQISSCFVKNKENK